MIKKNKNKIIKIYNNKYKILSSKKIKNLLYLLFKYQNTKKFFLNIKFVNKRNMTIYNIEFKNNKKCTNIISFPFIGNTTKEIDIKKTYNILGDIIICPEIIQKEAREKQLITSHHLSHIIIHGTLHLLGYTHNNINNAKIMENQEILILQKLKIKNPYN